MSELYADDVCPGVCDFDGNGNAYEPHRVAECGGPWRRQDDLRAGNRPTMGVGRSVAPVGPGVLLRRFPRDELRIVELLLAEADAQDAESPRTAPLVCEALSRVRSLLGPDAIGPL